MTAKISIILFAVVKMQKKKKIVAVDDDILRCDRYGKLVYNTFLVHRI